MAREASPAFQFYVKEWRSSRSIMRMSMCERGMYLEMLLEQWENLAVPDSADACHELIGGKLAEWRKAWPTLRRRFVPHDDGSGIFNIRLEFERSKQQSRSKRSEDKGRAGAAARWSKLKSGHKPHEADSTSIVQPSHSDASAIPPNGFALPIATSTALAIATPDARASQPRGSGAQVGRIFLHRWQVDELINILGPHAEDFGLDVWLDELSRSAGVLPKDRWAWVQAQLDAEVRRRGLLVESPPAVAGKQTTRLATALANIRAAEAV